MYYMEIKKFRFIGLPHVCQIPQSSWFKVLLPYLVKPGGDGLYWVFAVHREGICVQIVATECQHPIGRLRSAADMVLSNLGQQFLPQPLHEPQPSITAPPVGSSKVHINQGPSPIPRLPHINCQFQLQNPHSGAWSSGLQSAPLCRSSSPIACSSNSQPFGWVQCSGVE